MNHNFQQKNIKRMGNNHLEWDARSLTAGVIQLVSVIIHSFSCWSPSWAGEVRGDRPVYSGVWIFCDWSALPSDISEWFISFCVFRA